MDMGACPLWQFILTNNPLQSRTLVWKIIHIHDLCATLTRTYIEIHIHIYINIYGEETTTKQGGCLQRTFRFEKENNICLLSAWQPTLENNIGFKCQQNAQGMLEQDGTFSIHSLRESSQSTQVHHPTTDNISSKGKSITPEVSKRCTLKKLDLPIWVALWLLYEGLYYICFACLLVFNCMLTGSVSQK